MKLLLDTHTFIWWDSEQSKLSQPVLTRGIAFKSSITKNLD